MSASPVELPPVATTNNSPAPGSPAPAAAAAAAAADASASSPAAAEVKSPRKEKKEKKAKKEVKAAAASSSSAPKSVAVRYLKAVKDYEAKDDKELTLKKGDILVLKGRDESGYLEGELNKRAGFFPADAVEECNEKGESVLGGALLRLTSPRAGISSPSLVSAEQKARTKDRLEGFLDHRPAKEDLVHRNILHETNVAPALAEAQLKLQSQKTKDFLTVFFRNQADQKEPLLTEEAIDDLVLKMVSAKDGIPLGKHSKRLTSFEDVFVGREAMDWLLQQKIAADKPKAVEILEFLVQSRVLDHVSKHKPGFKGTRLYRFVLRDPHPRVLNGDKLWNSVGRDAVDVSIFLLSTLLDVLRKHRQPDGKVDFGAVRLTPEFVKYSLMSAELRTVDVAKLNKDQRRAFFCNCYQLLLLHGYAKLGAAPRSMLERKQLHEQCVFVLGGAEFSAELIEHFVLLGEPASAVLKDDPRNQLQLRLAAPEQGSWLWALSDGTLLTPTVRAYSPTTFEQLASAVAREYLASRVKVNQDTSEIVYPKILERYSKLFKVDAKDLRVKLASVLPDAVGKLYARMEELKLLDKLVVKFAPATHADEQCTNVFA